MPNGAWTETILYTFPAPDGVGYPQGGVTFDTNGNLYGSAFFGVGGGGSYGAVYELSPQASGPWTFTVIHNFTGGLDGGFPASKMTLDSNGNLYGQGQNQSFVNDIFELSPTSGGQWILNIVHVFTSGADGDGAEGVLAVDAKGNLYGNSLTGGLGCNGSLCGVVYELSPQPDGTWKEAILHQFESAEDGSEPLGSVLLRQFRKPVWNHQLWRRPRRVRHSVRDHALEGPAGFKESKQYACLCLLTLTSYFCKYRNMKPARSIPSNEQVVKYADMFSAMGTEPRLRIMQLLLTAHPEGLVVSEIQQELEIPNSTLSHHLDKLRMEDLVRVRRESTFLHYTANTEALQELLQFLYAECCTRNQALSPGSNRSNLQVNKPCDGRIEGENPMNGTDIKDVVKEKYGQAALRVHQRRELLLRKCSGEREEVDAAIQSHPTSTTQGRLVRFPRRLFWHRWAAAIPRRWPS